MMVFKMRDSVHSARYSPVCNVLRQWKTSLIPIYKVYRLYDIIYFYICTYELVQLHLLQGLRSAVVDNIRRRIVGVMFPPSIFEDRCVDFRRSMIDVSTFEDRCVALRRSMCRPSKIDVTMCRPSEIDVSTFEGRCVDFRRWMC